MIKTARILDLLLLVLIGTGALLSAAKSTNIAIFIGSTVGNALIYSPLWLTLLVFDTPHRRIEDATLIINMAALFLLACGALAIVIPLTDTAKSNTGLSMLPLAALLFIACALNIAAINKQRRLRATQEAADPMSTFTP
ncbi:MAG: hypothetical protein ACYDC8_17545 [Gammaproteobacteria bacterium]